MNKKKDKHKQFYKSVIALLLGVFGAGTATFAATILSSSEVGYKDNSRAALITRGLAEIARYGVALGANQKTFAGLTGIGDLFLTCSSKTSRNYSCGIEIGKLDSAYEYC